MKLPIAAAALFLTTTIAATAAADGNGFGEKGQLIVGADRLLPILSYSSTSETVTTGSTTQTTRRRGSELSFFYGHDLGVETEQSIPRITGDVVVIPRLTVGGGIVLGFTLGGSEQHETSNSGAATTTTTTNTPRTTVFGLTPRVGYVFPLGDFLSFWPRGGFSFYVVSSKTDGTSGTPPTSSTTTVSSHLLSLDLDPQLVITPVQHFFFNVGPTINIPITGGTTTETSSGAVSTSVDSDLSVFHIGVSAGLGGWFDLF